MASLTFEQENALHLAVGRADLCELLAVTFTYPKETGLAEALAGGAFAADAVSCLRDAGVDVDETMRASMALADFQGQEVESLQDRLHKGFSLLFLTPGVNVPVWPYEAPFRFVKAGRSGSPSLFRSPIAIDVEKLMREAGVKPKDNRTEPGDSIWNEFSYLSYVFGKQAEAIHAGDDEAAAQWLEHARVFLHTHLLVWAPDFFEKVQVEAVKEELLFGHEYAALAKFAAVALEAFEEFK